MRLQAMALTPVRDPALGSVRQKLALGLIVCLPVPVLAGSGLAIPLPSVVYRVAVAFAERSHEIAVRIPGLGAFVDESSEGLRAGTIRLSAAELGTPVAGVPPTEDVGRSMRRRGDDVRAPRGPRESAASTESSAPPVAANGEGRRPADQPARAPLPAAPRSDDRAAPTGEQPAPSPTTTTPPPSGGGEEPTPIVPTVPLAPELPNPGGVVPELPPAPSLPDPTSPGGVDLPSVPTLP
jgi:hypothetical protein